jgi:tRNA nucleotidyltransferase (CCA-adding enzyme)
LTPDRGKSRTADLQPPQDVIWIARKLREAGHAAWAVGGAVRDVLAGLEPGDWDLTTSAPPSDVRRIFRRTVPIGIEHGTVGVIARSGRMYEVTTFRRDVETFGRRARVVFADSLEEDLDRRDFTMNAVAWNPLTRELRDPHGGVTDLAAGVLRTVGDAERRFEEDRLRVLRAIRFAGAFQLRIEESTWTAIVASSDRLDDLSAERIREELRKVLVGQGDPSRSLHLYAESGVLRSLYPELDACRGVPIAGEEEDVWSFLVRCAASAPRGHYRVRMAAFLHGVGRGAVPERGDYGLSAARAGDTQDDPSSPASALAARSGALARNLLRRLRSSNADTDHITHLITQHDPIPSPSSTDAEIRRWVRRIGSDYVNDIFRLLIAVARVREGDEDVRRDLLALHRRTRDVLASRPALAVADLAIGGADLGRLGIPPGPRYREILDTLLERVLDDPTLNSPAFLLELVREIVSPEASTSHPPPETDERLS